MPIQLPLISAINAEYQSRFSSGHNFASAKEYKCCHPVSDEAIDVKTHERVAADEPQCGVFCFFYQSLLLCQDQDSYSAESLGGSAVAPPSISSVSYGDHDCFFDLPRTQKGRQGAHSNARSQPATTE